MRIRNKSIYGIVILLAIASAAVVYVYFPITTQSTSKKIVVILPSIDQSEFISGVELALEKINKSGGVLARPLNIEYIHEGVPLEEERTASLREIVPAVSRIADKLSKDSSVIAVVANGRSQSVVPIAVLLNNNHKLLISTNATSPTLTSIGLTYVFSLHPNDDDVSTVLSHYALDKNWRRFVLIGDGTISSIDFLMRMREEITRFSGEVLYEQNILHGNTDQIERTLFFLLDNKIFKSSDIDALIVCSKWPQGYSFGIKRARALGLNQPIIGPTNLASLDLEKEIGKNNMNGIIALSHYNDSEISNETTLFLQAFKQKYNRLPYQEAAVGYTAIDLLANTINETRSFDSSKLANKLRAQQFIKKFRSATGNISFDNSGLLTGENLHVVKHDGESFKTVASYSKPFTWVTDGDSYSHALLRSLITGAPNYKEINRDAPNKE
jgi:branched-chain amino acid transport system substrate-binding protein